MEVESIEVSGCSDSEGGSVRGYRKKQKQSERESEANQFGSQTRYQQWTKEVSPEVHGFALSEFIISGCLINPGRLKASAACGNPWSEALEQNCLSYAF